MARDGGGVTLDQRVASYGVLDASEDRGATDLALEELARLGYTTLDSGLREGELEELREKLAATYTRQAEALGGATLDESDDADIARCLLAYDPCFLRLATNPALLAFCKDALGEAFVLLQQNGIVNRPARANYQLRWHRDLPFQHWVVSKPIALAALLCLDEFNATTGGTYALPGSHLHERFPSEGFVRRHQEVVTALPGTFIVMDAMTFHRAGKNTSGAVRRGINHLIGLPFFAQQIDIPSMLDGAHSGDERLAAYLGYRWRPAPTVEAWRQRRL